MPRGSPRRRALQRLYNGQAFPTAVDETGRIVLPARLRQKVGLEDMAFFIGNGDTFEIWNPETYGRDMGAAAAADDSFDPDVDPSVYLDGDEG
jgi:MraZ protein